MLAADFERRVGPCLTPTFVSALTSTPSTPSTVAAASWTAASKPRPSGWPAIAEQESPAVLTNATLLT
jgi:hypothetical protein